MAATTLKIALLLATALSTHLSLSPPNPPAAKREKAGQKTVFEHWVLWITWLSKTFVWMAVSLDIVATLFVLYICSGESTPDIPFGYVSCPPPAVAKRLTSVSLLLSCGAMMSICGAMLRWRCFYELGDLFTFEITIRPKHVLVTTGPYGWVRHPAYVGVYASLIGASMVVLPRGSFIWEFGFQRSLAALQGCYTQSNSSLSLSEFSGSVVRCAARTAWQIQAIDLLIIMSAMFWLFKITFALNSTNKRLFSEDMELRKRFGLEWERYADIVKWRLFPGII